MKTRGRRGGEEGGGVKKRSKEVKEKEEEGGGGKRRRRGKRRRGKEEEEEWEEEDKILTTQLQTIAVCNCAEQSLVKAQNTSLSPKLCSTIHVIFDSISLLGVLQGRKN